MSEFGPSLREKTLALGLSATFILSGCEGKFKASTDNDRAVVPGDCAPKVIYDFTLDKGDYADVHGVENKSGEKNAIGLGYDDLPVKNPEEAPSPYPDEEDPSEDKEKTARVVSVTAYAGKLADPKAWFQDIADDYLEPDMTSTTQDLESGGSYALGFDQIDEDTIGVQAVVCGSPDQDKLERIKEEERRRLQNFDGNPVPPTPEGA